MEVLGWIVLIGWLAIGYSIFKVIWKVVKNTFLKNTVMSMINYYSVMLFCFGLGLFAPLIPFVILAELGLF